VQLETENEIRFSINHRNTCRQSSH